MKLCATVFEFHHTPSAMTGATGQSNKIAACNAASVTSLESRREKRQIPARG